MKTFQYQLCNLLLLLLLLLLLGVGGTRATAASDSSWSLELSNALGDRASLNKLWCASPTGDLTFGPVQGADTSSPDASIWAVTLSPDQFLIQLRLPSTLDYTCRLQSTASNVSLWSFSLPLSTLNQEEDGYGDLARDIKCHAPWRVPAKDIPPACDLFGSDDDGSSIASIQVTSLTLAQQSNIATAPAPSPSSTPLPSFDGSSATSVDSASSSSVSPPAPPDPAVPISESSEDTNSKQPIASPATSMSPSPAAAPTPVASAPTSMSASPPTPTNPTPTPADPSTTPPPRGRKLLLAY